MAKPKHGRWDNVPNSSHRTRTHAPSQAVLSALALIATIPPVVAGAPLPAFLCPFIERDHISPRAAVSLDTTPTSTSQSAGCDVVADKYVQGSDSLWRKTDTWTLYGSTCFSSLTASTSDVQPHSVSSQTLVPTSAPSSVNFDTSVLPAGWENTSPRSSSTESSIILALAIVLAGSICIFMIGCVIWRRRRKKARDIERKLGHNRGAHDDIQGNGQERDARGKMRMWAKATARWKSNIRHSARRRRKRHVLSSTVNRPPSPAFPDSPQPSSVALSAPSSRVSITSAEPDPSRPEAVSCINRNTSESPAFPHELPRSASPPTYGASSVPRFSCPPPSSAVPHPVSTSPVDPHSLRCSRQPSFTDGELLPYIPSDGHVATDDKSQLAHIRELASSPPMIPDVAGSSTVQSVSAPEWHEVEDDLEGLGIDLSEVPTSFHNFGFPPSFPPPPSKPDIPLGYLDDRLFRYGDGDDSLASLPVPGTSGPLFGTLSSAPPIDDLGIEPSAPSLEGDELFQDWDEASSGVPEVPTLTDLDSTPARATESSISSTVSSSRSSFPSVLESAVRDGILPQYYP